MISRLRSCNYFKQNDVLPVVDLRSCETLKQSNSGDDDAK